MLFSQMEPPPELEAEFNEWYETEHIPVRLALTGFTAAVRYRERGAARKYLAVYEIGDMSVLDSPGYQALKTRPSARTALMLARVKGFTRFTCTLASDTGASASARYLFAAGHDVPREHDAEFSRWWADERAPACMALRGCMRTRRYAVISADGAPWTSISMHELSSIGELPTAPAEEQYSQATGHWLYEVISVHSRERVSK
jgi:hypothetical protein